MFKLHCMSDLQFRYMLSSCVGQRSERARHYSHMLFSTRCSQLRLNWIRDSLFVKDSRNWVNGPPGPRPLCPNIQHYPPRAIGSRKEESQKLTRGKKKAHATKQLRCALKVFPIVGGCLGHMKGRCWGKTINVKRTWSTKHNSWWCVLLRQLSDWKQWIDDVGLGCLVAW